MNKFIATIIDIHTHSSLNLIDLIYGDTRLTMNTLELPSSIQKGSKLEIGIKPFHIAIAKNLRGEISFSNRLETTIVEIEQGELLSSIICKKDDDLFEVIITTKSLRRMALESSESVELLIKASELFITRFLDD
ncbi:MAG: transporter [Campylobacterales bacterium]